MADDVNIKISATDNATATLRAVQAQLNSFSSSVKNLAAFTVAGLGVQQIGSFLAGSLREYAEAEKSQTRLQSVLKATGNTTKLTFSQISEFTDQLEKTTGTSGEALNDAAANLSRFSNITGNQFKEVLSLANDMSAVLGSDVTSNVQLLAKALNNPAEGLSRLSRLGVSFNEVQKEQITLLDEVGKKAEAQSKILDEIRRQFGGAGAEFGRTTAGQLEILNARIGDLKEAIGETLASAIVPLIKSIENAAGNRAAAILKSQAPESIDNKVAELAALNADIGNTQGVIYQLQSENRESQRGGVSWAFRRYRDERDAQIAQLRERLRVLADRREQIAPTADVQALQQEASVMLQARLRQIDQQQNRAFFGFLAQGGALGGVNAQAQVTAEDVGMAIGREIRGIVAGQGVNAPAREQSLQATESRFLTRGRGQLTNGEKILIDETKKMAARMERMAKSFEELQNNGNIILIGGID